MEPSLPPVDMCKRQAEWLAPARATVLRRASVARRQRVLEIGAGSGAVSDELARRCAGFVAALDRSSAAIAQIASKRPNLYRLCGLAERLPFADRSFDLVFFQLALMWMDATLAIAEAVRVLAPGGALVAIEPDYGGMIEHPPAIESRELWISGLRRANADPFIGRKLPALLESHGLHPRMDLFSELRPAAPERLDLLEGLPLTAQERDELARIRCADAGATGQGESVLAYLPFLLVTATRVHDC